MKHISLIPILLASIFFGGTVIYVSFRPPDPSYLTIEQSYALDACYTLQFANNILTADQQIKCEYLKKLFASKEELRNQKSKDAIDKFKMENKQ